MWSGKRKDGIDVCIKEGRLAKNRGDVALLRVVEQKGKKQLAQITLDSVVDEQWALDLLTSLAQGYVDGELSREQVKSQKIAREKAARKEHADGEKARAKEADKEEKQRLKAEKAAAIAAEKAELQKARFHKAELQQAAAQIKKDAESHKKGKKPPTSPAAPNARPGSAAQLEERMNAPW